MGCRVQNQKGFLGHEFFALWVDIEAGGLNGTGQHQVRLGVRTGPRSGLEYKCCAGIGRNGLQGVEAFCSGRRIYFVVSECLCHGWAVEDWAGKTSDRT